MLDWMTCYVFHKKIAKGFLFRLSRSFPLVLWVRRSRHLERSTSRAGGDGPLVLCPQVLAAESESHPIRSRPMRFRSSCALDTKCLDLDKPRWN